MRKSTLAIFFSGLWITVSEFLRNEILFKNYWIEHYEFLGLEFQTRPLNGILWLVWSFILAYLIFQLLQKFSFKQSVLLAWLGAFVLMWITIYNLQVMPTALLIFAIPLSLLEAYLAAAIIKKINK